MRKLQITSLLLLFLLMVVVGCECPRCDGLHPLLQTGITDFCRLDGERFINGEISGCNGLL